MQVRTESTVTVHRSVGEIKVEITHQLDLIGGKREDWYCDTSSDAEEALSHHRALRRGEWILVKCQTYRQAVELKTLLAEAKLSCGPDGVKRGGPELFCFRVRLWNCSTLPRIRADWVYEPIEQIGPNHFE